MSRTNASSDPVTAFPLDPTDSFIVKSFYTAVEDFEMCYVELNLKPCEIIYLNKP